MSPAEIKLKDMNEAVERTYKSIMNFNLIGIFGDYDVDGATSTALLSLYFSSINKDFNTKELEDKAKWVRKKLFDVAINCQHSGMVEQYFVLCFVQQER